MYAPGTLRTVIPGLTGTDANRDLRCSQFAHFLAAAGWSIREVGCEFTVTTTGAAGSFALAGESTYIFWRVTNLLNGNCGLVGDVDSVIVPNLGDKCPACGLRLTGNNSAAATHAGVVAQILCVTTGWSAVPLTPTSTRFVSDKASSSSISLDIGGQLSTTVTLPASQGGYVCRSKPSTKQVLVSGIPTEYGGGAFNPCKLKVQGRTTNRQNYIELYVHNSKNASNRAMYFQGAKEFKPRPADSVVRTSGLITDATEVCVIDGLTYVINDTSCTQPNSTPEVQAGTGGAQSSPDLHCWATPYGVFAMARDLATPTRYWSLLAGALKLVDSRLIAGIGDLPITEATVIDIAITTGTNQNWARGGMGRGNKRFCLNGDARFSSNILDKGSPQLFFWGSASPTLNTFYRWLNGATCLGEPWIGFNPYDETKLAPMLGQWHDGCTVAEITTFLSGGQMPPNLALFNWDGQPFRRVNETVTAANQGPVTLALRETGYWFAGQVIS